MKPSEHALRGQRQFLEPPHGLEEIVECRAGVVVEHCCVIPPHPDRDFMTLAKNALRHGYHLAQNRLGFFEALGILKGARVVHGRYEGVFMVRTVELQTSKIYVSLNRIGLIKPSQFRIRARKIGLQG